MITGNRSALIYFAFEEINYPPDVNPSHTAPPVFNSLTCNSNPYLRVVLLSLSRHCILAISRFSVPVSVLSKFRQNPNSLATSTKNHAGLMGLLFHLQTLSQTIFQENLSLPNMPRNS